jgi:carboxymethylenebutenolidase
VSPTPEFESLVPEQSFSRRDFIVTGLGAGFALAVQPVMAQTAIQTDTRGLSAGEVKVPVKDGEMAAYRAQPAGKDKLPTILVVSEIFGVHEHIQDICRRLAKLGYLAVAPELFARQGDPRRLGGIAEIQEKITSRTPDTQVISDLDDTAAWAMKNGGDPARLGITGFCWGGRMTWLYAAHNPGLKAGVAWYGRLVGNVTDFTPRHPTDVAAQLRAPVLGLYGGLDAGIPRETVDAMEKRLKAAENPNSNASEIIVYDNAPHAFHADYRPSYRKDEAEDGWGRMQDWFKKHGV